MSLSNWKACERRHAELTGGERVPITGRQRGDVPDVRHPWLSIESKCWARGVGERLNDALSQAKAAARGDQLPIAIVHEDGTRYLEDVVLMKLGDFLDWFGPVVPHG